MMYRYSWLLVFLPVKFYGQVERHVDVKDTIAYFKSRSVTSLSEHFEGIRITSDTNDFIILIKNDSLYVTYKKRHFPVESLDKLDDLIKNVLKKKKNASFEVCTYAYDNSTGMTYEKVMGVLRRNNILHFTNSMAFPVAP